MHQYGSRQRQHAEIDLVNDARRLATSGALALIDNSIGQTSRADTIVV
jgi:hypothetical protein